MQFDIEEFYRSISKYLLVKTINHARTSVDISSKEMHSRKFLLFNNAGRWIKKDGDEDFDVTMDSFNGAEICELMDLFILYTLGEKMERKLLLCMGMIAQLVLKALVDRKQIELEKILSVHLKTNFTLILFVIHLNIVCDANLKIDNFLDVTLNLSNGKYQPYKKPGNSPLYININSNHPSNIKKDLRESIFRHISKLSSDQGVFDHSKDFYNAAISNKGFKQKVNFDPSVYVTHIIYNNS